MGGYAREGCCFEPGCRATASRTTASRCMSNRPGRSWIRSRVTGTAESSRAGRCEIESHDGAVISSRAHPRAAFFGRSGLRRNIRWDPLDSVYFAGYAMWNYLTTPYLLTREGVAVEEGAPWQQEGETWRRLIVSFPPDIDTHSPRQTFYVDASGLLRRHDYVPEVVGHWARAAHYCADPVDVDGFVFPTCRWVHPIGPGNRSLPFPTLVSILLTDIRVETD